VLILLMTGFHVVQSLFGLSCHDMLYVISLMKISSGFQVKLKLLPWSLRRYSVGINEGRDLLTTSLR
jgi:hypothetical protein